MLRAVGGPLRKQAMSVQIQWTAAMNRLETIVSH
jgi:hypothetical protein